jgi:hypothetical protein
VDRSIGLDVHRDFCQVAIADGGRARSAGRVAVTPEQLELRSDKLAGAPEIRKLAIGSEHEGDLVLARGEKPVAQQLDHVIVAYQPAHRVMVGVVPDGRVQCQPVVVAGRSVRATDSAKASRIECVDLR